MRHFALPALIIALPALAQTNIANNIDPSMVDTTCPPWGFTLTKEQVEQLKQDKVLWDFSDDNVRRINPAENPAEKPVVKIATTYGAMTVELDPEAAPKTVANFLRYVKEGHFKGTIFHRVIDGFMIQGGGLDEKLVQKPAHAGIANETAHALAAGLHNTRGTIALARTQDPDSGADQFYINLVDNAASLDAGSYCPFGRVIAGMEVADAIAKVRTGFQKGMSNVPDFPVRIKDAQLVK